jgi:GTP:adenosylcobinamide-phosphate guanylyltransferase
MPDDKYCLILAAGFGTRMGEIGKVLPKVLWPVFETSILELQVLFAKSLGYKKIYINLFHQAEEIKSYCKTRISFKNVGLIQESPEILDIGGAVHNIASLPSINYSGQLLVLNADQMLWFDQEKLALWNTRKDKWDSLILCKKVNSSQGYNQILLDPDNFFRGIKKNQTIERNSEILTYTGNSLINLAAIIPRKGSSSFFDSVCSTDKKVYVEEVSALPYWDFGTKNRYYESLLQIIQKISANTEDEFIEFLVREGSVKKEKISAENVSYGCSNRSLINLGTLPVPEKHSAGVILKSGVNADDSRVALIYDKLVDYLD